MVDVTASTIAENMLKIPLMKEEIAWLIPSIREEIGFVAVTSPAVVPTAEAFVALVRTLLTPAAAAGSAAAVGFGGAAVRLATVRTVVEENARDRAICRPAASSISGRAAASIGMPGVEPDDGVRTESALPPESDCGEADAIVGALSVATGASTGTVVSTAASD